MAWVAHYAGGVFLPLLFHTTSAQKASEKKLRLENAWCFFLPPPIWVFCEGVSSKKSLVKIGEPSHTSAINADPPQRGGIREIEGVPPRGVGRAQHR